jgi:hypothetical protein
MEVGNMSISVRCRCGDILTIRRIEDNGQLTLEPCNNCVIAAYALGFDDSTAEEDEKTEFDDIYSGTGRQSV